MVVNTVRLVASQFSKINRPIPVFLISNCVSCKTQVTVENNLAHGLRYDLVRLIPVFLISNCVSCKTQVTVENNLAHGLRYDLVQLSGSSCSSTSLKRSNVS